AVRVSCPAGRPTEPERAGRVASTPQGVTAGCHTPRESERHSCNSPPHGRRAGRGAPPPPTTLLRRAAGAPATREAPHPTQPAARTAPTSYVANSSQDASEEPARSTPRWRQSSSTVSSTADHLKT